MICDIRQDYLHAQNLAARSRTPPTPTFPSENFDLPPITPPGSLHAAFAAGQQPLRMALMSNLRSTSMQSQLPSFVSPNMPPPMSNASINQSLPPVVNDSLVEGSNIDELIDEIVERDMPQGVTEPIVFPPHVSQQPNPGAAHLQMTSNTVHKRISPAAAAVTNPGQMTVTPTSGTGSSSLPIEVVMAGSPLNSPASPGSPLATSRSSSPNAKAANLAGKVSAPVRTGNQAMRFTQPGSPLQNATQPAVKSGRAFPVKTSQGLTSQLLQMAVPSAVASLSAPKSQVLSPQLHSPTSVLAKHSIESNVNTQNPRNTLASSVVQSSVRQVQGQTINSIPNKVSPPNLVQGNKVGSISLQSSGKPIQAIPIQTLASNSELLSQLVKAMGQQNAKPQGSGTNPQANQPLICYVVPQSSASGGQNSQTLSTASSSSQPMKMILVNANSPLKLPATLNPLTGSTTTVANTGLKCKPTVPPTQLTNTKIGLDTAASQSLSKELDATANLLSLPAIKSGTITTGNNITSPLQLTTASFLNNQKPVSTLSPVEQVVSRFLGSNPSVQQNASSVDPSEKGVLPILQTPVSTSGNVVQITFVNEATAISHVVAASSASTTLSSSWPHSSVGMQNIVGASQAAGIVPSSSQMLEAATDPVAQTDVQESEEEDDEDDDSRPLSQVAENLKKIVGTDEVKKRRKKKKDKEKGAKRKRKGKDTEGLDM